MFSIMKNVTAKLFGLTLVVIGVILLGNLFDFWDVNLLFDGWWTVFIIIPSVANMIEHGVNTGNMFGLGIGCILLLFAQNAFDQAFIWEAGIAILFILIGIKIMFGSRKKQIDIDIDEEIETTFIDIEENKEQDIFAIFGKSEPNYDNLEFTGLRTQAVFGGVNLNLKNAIINKDCKIKCESIFGGTNIKLPDNVQLKVFSKPIFGGVSNKFSPSADKEAPIVYIEATSIFGGIEIN